MSGSYYDDNLNELNLNKLNIIPTQSSAKLSNPFKVARLNHLKMKVEVAEMMAVTPQYIDRLEESLFPTVPLRVVEFYSECLDLSPTWEKEYTEFRNWLRKRAISTLSGTIELEDDSPLSFKEFRNRYWPDLSQIQWCRAFRVHPSSVYALERGGQVKFPDDIAEALVLSRVMTRSDVWKLADKIKASSAKKPPKIWPGS